MPIIYDPDDPHQEVPIVSTDVKTPISPKVYAGGGAGVVVTAGLTVAGAYGLDVPPEVAAAVVTIVSFAAGYLTPDRLRKLGALADRFGKGGGEHRA